MALLADQLEAALGTEQEQELITRVTGALNAVTRCRAALPRQLRQAANAVHAPRTRILGLITIAAGFVGGVGCLLGWFGRGLLLLLVVYLIVGAALATAPAPDLDKPVGTEADDRFQMALLAVAGLVLTGLSALSPWWLLGAVPMTVLSALGAAAATGKLDQSTKAGTGGSRG
ncbi:hypothetical protein CLV43_1284 [Umezawaea tangerina]|uniref:Uncharacterized protein n=1 Tax=Umezawaea tangerina TaxID=84725 RepID=A0A2T0S569_9PSEU|nr:hypothetical protein CLV43_1284 [Umezawaea tangerina]